MFLIVIIEKYIYFYIYIISIICYGILLETILNQKKKKKKKRLDRH